MVDRPTRTRLLNAITAYLHGEIQAFEFDERIHEAILKTQDRTAQFARTALWQLYDDVTDHPVHLSKEAWDFVQRLRLVLASNVEIETDRGWTLRQPLAIFGLLFLIMAACHFGVAWDYWRLSMLVGFPTVLYLYLPTLIAPRKNQEKFRLVPFESLSQLLAIHRTVTDFQKEKYPLTLAGKRLRSPLWTAIMVTVSAAAMSAIAPLPLLLCLLPTPKRIKVLTP